MRIVISLRATELDHYLPKSVFGEYSIYSPNLVPICRQCNGTKLNRYRLDAGGRRYLHPYFDKLPEGKVQYLSANISIGLSVTIEFEPFRPAQMSDELWNILCYQFEELKLGIRYMEDATESITGMIDVFYSNFDRGGATEVRHHLGVEKRSRERVYGVNHWWPVTLGALASSDEFCEAGFMCLGPRDIGIDTV